MSILVCGGAGYIGSHTCVELVQAGYDIIVADNLYNSSEEAIRRVEQIVEQNLKLAGLDGRGYSPHKLRHTAATLMYQHGGVDIRVLKEILGHVNLGTTEIYTHVANSQVESAIRDNPLGSIAAPRTKKAVTNKED